MRHNVYENFHIFARKFGKNVTNNFMGTKICYRGEMLFGIWCEMIWGEIYQQTKCNKGRIVMGVKCFRGQNVRSEML